MKKLILVLTLLMFQFTVRGLDTLKVSSKITDLTVFFSGAQVTRHVELDLTIGKHLLIADQLPNELFPHSVMVGAVKDITILSVKHQLIFSDDNQKGKEEKEIQDELDGQELKIKALKNQLAVCDIEEKLLLDNGKLGRKDEGVTVTDIKEAADFYRIRFNEIREKKLDIAVEMEKISDKIRELYVRLNEVYALKRRVYSQIMISVECTKPIKGGFDLSYYVPSAGWTPTYDFRVDDITQPLTIVYNANVFQSTGEDWNNVNLKLSSNNPSLSGNKPELSTWYLGRMTTATPQPIKHGQGALRGRVVDAETGEAMPFANVVLERNNQMITGSVTDIDGQYNIKPIPAGSYSVKVSYVGYQTTQVTNVTMQANKVTVQDFQIHADKTMLESVVVAEYSAPRKQKEQSMAVTKVTSQEIMCIPGASANSFGWVGDGTYSGSNEFWARAEESRERSVSQHKDQGIVISNYISNSLKNNITNMEYVIDIPYTIPTNGEDYTIRIKEVRLPVKYVYHAVPKVESDVFLTAEIADWAPLNLLAGEMNIYYQGTYTGRSYIDVDKASDTLSISLGRDYNIFVTREGNKSLFDKRQIGSNIRETIAWEITVRNAKDAAITIVVEDQFPVSEKKSIEVEQLEYEGARLDENSGKLSWTLLVEPGAKREVTYKYAVKYPKSVNLMLE